MDLSIIKIYYDPYMKLDFRKNTSHDGGGQTEGEKGSTKTRTKQWKSSFCIVILYFYYLINSMENTIEYLRRESDLQR